MSDGKRKNGGREGQKIKLKDKEKQVKGAEFFF